MLKVRSENDCGARKMHLAHWPRNLSHSLPKMEAMCSKYINITSSCMKTSPGRFQHSSKHQNICIKPFCEFCSIYKVILSLNMSNLAHFLNKIAFSAQKSISAEILCFLSHRKHLTSP